jgi:hypothetical protein
LTGEKFFAAWDRADPDDSAGSAFAAIEPTRRIAAAAVMTDSFRMAPPKVQDFSPVSLSARWELRPES